MLFVVSNNGFKQSMQREIAIAPNWACKVGILLKSQAKVPYVVSGIARLLLSANEEFIHMFFDAKSICLFLDIEEQFVDGIELFGEDPYVCKLVQ